MSLNLSRSFRILAFLLVVSPTSSLRAANVAVWIAGLGNSDRIDAEIAASGRSRKTLTDLNLTSLDGINRLFLMNPSNSSYATDVTSFADDLETFVFNGGDFHFYDRAVGAGALDILPVSSSFKLTRSFTNADNLALLPGAAGTIIYTGFTDISFDNGNFSSHGYADAASLGGATTYLSIQGEPTKVVEFSYAFGAGTVTYSTIPADLFLDGVGGVSMQNTIRQQITNILTIPEPSISLHLGMVMSWLIYRRRRRADA